MPRSATLLLRLAISFSFFYVAYGFWADANDWIGFVPAFVKNIGVPQALLIDAIAVFHLIIALWILSGWRIFLPSLAAAFFLLGVVYFNWNQMYILFRDISLALAALALALTARGK